jgi:nucleoside-diphosphate-sugar epimerase
MEKDDFKYTLSFGEDVFGGPRWRDLVGAEQADRHVANGAVPVMLDPEGAPILRNFVHVEDLAEAIMAALGHAAAHQQLFNICMDEPVDYRIMADYLHETRGLPSVDVPTPFHRTWLDNSKAKFLLDWRPEYDLAGLIDGAWDYERSSDNPRKIWYPG